MPLPLPLSRLPDLDLPFPVLTSPNRWLPTAQAATRLAGRTPGELLWQWNAPKSGGSAVGGYMTLLPDRDRLVVSAGGYIYCLDPGTGQERWHNPLTGFGVGVAALATIRSHSPHGDVASAAAASAAASRQAATAAAIVAAS